jgi:putative zinc finger protein
MNCELARAQLGAWVDGQLEPGKAAELDAHVAECAECRAELDGLRALHADLVRAFAAPRAAAARVALAAFPPVSEGLASRKTTGGQAATRLSSPKSSATRRWQSLVSLALAMAIGFLLAVLIFRPWKSPKEVLIAVDRSTNPAVEDVPGSPTRAPSDPSIARLVVATKAEGVEVNDRIRKDWQPVAEISKFQCPSEGSVRTNSGSRCEIVTSEGCVVRMNSGTEIVVLSPARIELRRGEIWCRSTATAPLEVIPALSSSAVKPASPGVPVMTCAAGDAACLLRIAKAGDRVSVTAETGSVDVKAHDKSLELRARESAIITGEQIRLDGSSDALLDTSWMQPLLIRKGHANRELAKRVNDLLARVGETKQPELYETEIRSLGEYSVLPLLRYVESPRSDSNPWRRTAAMRIISDLAPAWAIGDLVGLLKHSDADVRVLAAAALSRLTQQTQGVTPDKWRGPPADWQPAAAAWQKWWAKNSDRFPHLPETQQR